MKSSDGMSSNVGVVSFASVDNSMSDDDASVDGNGGMWIINEVIASLSFVGLQLMLESVAAVVVVTASMLNITFFMMIEKNAYIVIASLWMFAFAAIETWIQFLLEQFRQDVNVGIFLPALDIWSYESFCSDCTRTIQSYESRTLVCRMSQLPSTREMIHPKLINNSGTLEWVERARSLVIDSSRAVEISP
jgi:hypothetical protein